MRLTLALLLVSSFARADARLDAHFGGGLEGGLISGKPHPDAVGEVGIGGEWIDDDAHVGVGVSLEAIARPGHDLAHYEEAKLDLLLRFGKDRRRGGVGAGVRALTPEPIDGQRQPTMFGIDMIRLDLAMPLAHVERATFGVGVDAYFAWTFGCYLGRGDAMVERPELVREVSCGDTLTSTYVLGLALSLDR